MKWRTRRQPTATLALAAALLVAAIGVAVDHGDALATTSALPAGFHTRLVVGKLAHGPGGIPTAFAYAPGGRVFVARKRGVVDVYDHGAQHVFVDLSADVNSAQGRGLLGLAVDPHFTATRRVYLMFTTNAHRHGLDSRGDAGGEIISIRASHAHPDRAVLSTRVTLMTGYDSSAPQHADGALRFDHAGNLLAGWGDGSPDEVSKTALKAQSLDDLRGKIIRINPTTGAGVPGNPWYSAAHPKRVRSKIYVYGLRNPYRFTVDQQNGSVYVGDVGWSSYDELDAFGAHPADPKRDRNGGWPCYEGADGQSAPQARYRTDPATAAACKRVYPPGRLDGTGVGAQPPLWAYPHDGTACIIAGPKYTGGSNYPKQYVGRVFVADWARDSFHTVDATTGAAKPLGSGWGNALDIQLAPDGNVAFLAEATNSLREITYSR
jgi:glucose/arabinose dehydrogenase